MQLYTSVIKCLLVYTLQSIGRMILTMKKLQTMVMDRFGEPLNEIGYSLMTGKFDLTEVSQNGSFGCHSETELRMIVCGQELIITLVGGRL